MMDVKEIGSFIAHERKAKNFTQADLARRLYVSEKTVSKWENGRGLPDTGLLLNLCSILDVTVNELLCGRKLDEMTEKSEAQKNALKTVLTKKELETMAILTELLIFAGIVITMTLTSILAVSVLQKIMTIVLGSFVWGYGIFLRVKIRKTIFKLQKIDRSAGSKQAG